MNPFLNASYYAFHKAWQAYARVRPKSGRDGDAGQGRKLAEVWREHGDGLRLTWEGFARAVMGEQSFLALRLWLACRERIRGLWLKPGGYFYTRHGNPRRGTKVYLARIRQKLVPKVPQNLLVDLDRAERDWTLAQQVESARVRPSRLRRRLKGDSDFSTQFMGILLFATGALTGPPDEPTLLNGLKRKRLLWPTKSTISPHWWQRRWGWQRREGMKAAGWLESLGDGRVLK